MHKMSLPQDALHDIHALLQEPTSLERAGLPVHGQRCFVRYTVARTLGCVTRGTSQGPAMGSRHGDSFAHIIFGYMWNTVLHKLEQHLIDQHIILPMQSHEQLPLFGREYSPGEPESLPIFLGQGGWMTSRYVWRSPMRQSLLRSLETSADIYLTCAQTLCLAQPLQGQDGIAAHVP